MVPAYNEEAGLEATIVGQVKGMKELTEDYEILIINDKSEDRTAEIADRLAREHNRVRVVHNEINRGLGYNYQLGYQLATKEYVILIPGDNEVLPESVNGICREIGSAEIIITYMENAHIRPPVRRLASWGFTCLVNWISGYRLRYYNGTNIQKKANLMRTTPVTASFAFQAEILLQLLKMGLSYREVPFQLNFSSKRIAAFNPKNVLNVNLTLLRLIWKYRIAPILRRSK